MALLYRHHDQKKPNTPRINKIRIINIYEADDNLLQKFFWPKLSTKHAEASHTLGKNTWGCRSGCSADNVAMLDKSMTEVHRLTFTNLFKFQYDAKACFDCIINSRAMLTSRKFEVTDKICQIHSATLRSTEYRVQTALGTSNQYYKHSDSAPIHGNGQGAGSSRTVWVYISVPVMSTLDKYKEDCIIISPDKKIQWKKIIVGFVDDKR